MRRVMVVAAVLAAFSQSSTVAYGDVVTRRPPPDIYPRPRPQPIPEQRGLCRRAPELPKMQGETGNQNQTGPSRWTPRLEERTTDRDMVAPPVLASPSAPPPPPPPPPPSGESGASAFESRARDSAGRAGSAAKVAPSPTSVPSSMTVTETRGETMRRIAPPSRPSNQQVQSGQLTAGEHDDLLNPGLYARYVDQFLAGESLSGVPRVDTRNALSVIVQDNAGAPMPFATVTLTCSDGNSLSLTTMADGRVVFFPDLDRLGTAVMMTAGYGQRQDSAPRRINVADVRGAQEVLARVTSSAPRVNKFDLAVVIDATGSMGDEINFLKAELAEIIATISRRHRGLDIRVALVVYRDQGDEFVTRTFEFTNNMSQVQSNLGNQSAGGGGDTPEAMEVAMSRAVGLNWRNDAIKSMLLVADAPPHSGDVAMTWAATEAARAKRIQIVPVAASGVDDAAQYIMRAMAAATQSRYAFLTDDSGIGNAHAEPSVDCYHVTKLDGLIRRILDAQISGRRIEPENNEIVRTVGDYDKGKCRAS